MSDRDDTLLWIILGFVAPNDNLVGIAFSWLCLFFAGMELYKRRKKQ
jgi:hypothetical protein